MSERTTLEAQRELESLAAKLIEKYPQGYLAGIEIAWPHCQMALRAPLRGLDSPRAILEGSWKELRAFEIVYERLKANFTSSMAIDAYAFEPLQGETAYWQAKQAQEA